MEATSEAVDPYPDDPDDDVGVGSMRVSQATEVAEPAPARPRTRTRTRTRERPRTRSRTAARTRTRARALTADARRELLWITVVYLAARAVIIVAAVMLDAFGHHDLQKELANWDGLWYRDVANNGYPHHVSTGQTNLGFFPLFPISIWLVEPILLGLTTHNQIWASTFSGVLISGAGGLIATIFVHKLAEGWWDRATARRATLLFVFFPGAVVFSMVYSEALLLPLAAVCIWALERRRWVLAGVMAGLGTAVQPVGLLLSVVCGVCALRELWRHGPRARDTRLSVLATALSAVGVLSFMGFLWTWTGNPFANYIAQHRGWQEKTDPLALVHMWNRLVPSFDPSHFNHPVVNANLIAGLVGAVLMLYELVLLFLSRREVSLPAITWSLGIVFFACTSEYVPPNPRMVITAFPMLMLIARYVRGKRFPLVMFFIVVLFVGLSLLTFYAHVLRP